MARLFWIFVPIWLFSESIIFVHIGKHIPEYAHLAVKQASLVSPKSSVYFLIDSPEFSAYQKMHQFRSNVEIVDASAVPSTFLHNQFRTKSRQDMSYRDGFWRYTSERFLTLYDFCMDRNIQAAYHLENDVMLYFDVEKYVSLFRKHYPMMGVTADSDDRVVGGLIYFSRRDSLRALCKLTNVLSTKGVDDMKILTRAKQRSSQLHCLPIFPPVYGRDNKLVSKFGNRAKRSAEYSQGFHALNLVFDACAIGQYLGGIDPVHKGAELITGFINEMSIVNPSHFEYSWEESDGLRYPYLHYKGKRYKLANLHIHSKNLDRFTSF